MFQLKIFCHFFVSFELKKVTKHTFAKHQHTHEMTLIVYHSHVHKVQPGGGVTYRRLSMPYSCSNLQEPGKLIFY